jgi:hypothetical protein
MNFIVKVFVGLSALAGSDAVSLRGAEELVSGKPVVVGYTRPNTPDGRAVYVLPRDQDDDMGLFMSLPEGGTLTAQDLKEFGWTALPVVNSTVAGLMFNVAHQGCVGAGPSGEQRPITWRLSTDFCWARKCRALAMYEELGFKGMAGSAFVFQQPIGLSSPWANSPNEGEGGKGVACSAKSPHSMQPNPITGCPEGQEATGTNVWHWHTAILVRVGDSGILNKDYVVIDPSASEEGPIPVMNWVNGLIKFNGNSGQDAKVTFTGGGACNVDDPINATASNFMAPKNGALIDKGAMEAETQLIEQVNKTLAAQGLSLNKTIEEILQCGNPSLMTLQLEAGG